MPIPDGETITQKGLMTIELSHVPSQICDFGIQVANDGRIWICINGVSFIRFKPLTKTQLEGLKNAK